MTRSSTSKIVLANSTFYSNSRAMAANIQIVYARGQPNVHPVAYSYAKPNVHPVAYSYAKPNVHRIDPVAHSYTKRDVHQIYSVA